MNKAERWRQMESLVEEKVSSLVSMKLPAIRSLRNSTEDVQFEKWSATLNVYHELDFDEGHRVIVQGVRQGIARLTALVIQRGFVLTNIDKIRRLRDHELFGYT